MPMTNIDRPVTLEELVAFEEQMRRRDQMTHGAPPVPGIQPWQLTPGQQLGIDMAEGGGYQFPGRGTITPGPSGPMADYMGLIEQFTRGPNGADNNWITGGVANMAGKAASGQEVGPMDWLGAAGDLPGLGKVFAGIGAVGTKVLPKVLGKVDDMATFARRAMGGIPGEGLDQLTKIERDAARSRGLAKLSEGVQAATSRGRPGYSGATSPAVGPALPGGVTARGPQFGPFKRETDISWIPRESFGGQAKAFYEIRPELASDPDVAALGSHQFVELRDTPKARAMFRERGLAAKRDIGPEGAQVDIYDKQSYYAGSRLFMGLDGKMGFAIKPDGDVVSVWKDPGYTGGPNAGSVAVALATQEGGRKLDAFDRYLPTKIYDPVGYEHRAGTPWNEEYAPEGWDTDKLGEPNVTAMAYAPDRVNRYQYPLNPTKPRPPIEVPNQFEGPTGYDDALQARDESGLWTPELTPGVSERLHGLTSRPPKRGQRPTVKAAGTRPLYNPAMYGDPQATVEMGRRNVAPENPLMRRLFGVGRQELDDLTRQHSGRLPQVGEDVLAATRPRRENHVSLLDTGPNNQRLQDVLALGAADPAFAGSYGWYQTLPLRKKFQELLGLERGDAEFDRFMEIGSVLSTSSPVDNEIRRASLYRMNELAGTPERFLNRGLTAGEDVLREFPELFDGNMDLAAKYSNIRHSSTHAKGLRKMQGGGHAFEPGQLNAPKTYNYYQSKIGGNYLWPTADAHNIRATGLVDVRPDRYEKLREWGLADDFQGAAPELPELAGFEPVDSLFRDVLPPDPKKWKQERTKLTGSIWGSEVRPYRDWFANKVAKPVGMEGSPAQALMWNIFAPQTGVKTEVGKPFLELITDGVEREAKRTGKDPEKVLEEFILGIGILGQNEKGPGMPQGLLAGDGEMVA